MKINNNESNDCSAKIDIVDAKMQEQIMIDIQETMSKKLHTNGEFIALGSSDIERSAIRDLCESIDSYYSEMENMKTSDNPSQYLISRVSQINKEGKHPVDENNVELLVDDVLNDDILDNTEAILDSVEYK